MFPIYTTRPTSERERLARLMARRRALPVHLREFPQPPAYLSARELDIWNDLRGAFSGIGAVGADQFAVIEMLVAALAAGDRLREVLNKVPIHNRPSRIALIAAIEQEDASVLRSLEFLGVTRAMRVYLASRSGGTLTPERVGLTA
jgi:hypothetical protein